MRTMNGERYCELHCKTNYSFLVGASHADELVDRAIELGYSALAITDENTLAGVVRAFSAVRDANQKITENKTHRGSDASCGIPNRLKLIIGAEIIPHDAPPVVLWATDRTSYANLARLLTVGRRRAPKGECWLSFDDVVSHAGGLLAGIVPCIRGDRCRTDHMDEAHPGFEWFVSHSHCRPRAQHPDALHAYRELFEDRAYLLAELYRGVDDAWRIEQLKIAARRSGLPLVAAGDVLYHGPARLPLHDVLTATRHQTTVAQAGDLLLPNARATSADHPPALSGFPVHSGRNRTDH